MQTKRLLDNLWKKKFFHFLVATHSPPTDPLASFLCRLSPGGSFISVAIPSTGEKNFFGVSAGSGLAKLCSRQRLQILAKLYRFLTKNCKILVMARKKLTIFLAGMFRPDKKLIFWPREFLATYRPVSLKLAKHWQWKKTLGLSADCLPMFGARQPSGLDYWSLLTVAYPWIIQIGDVPSVSQQKHS